MIATGNHNFERFAALCNTLSGEPRRLRRCGSPNWRPLQGAGETIGSQQPTKYTPSASLCSAAPSEREPRRLRRSGRQPGDPYGTHSIYRVVHIFVTRAIVVHNFSPRSCENCGGCWIQYALFGALMLPGSTPRTAEFVLPLHSGQSCRCRRRQCGLRTDPPGSAPWE